MLHALDNTESLSRFRYHTGASLRPVEPDEPCRVLFRDIGPAAMVQYLRGELQRLAGPLAPILYTRTADYAEPFVDHIPVGRLVFLKPKQLRPWHSGVPTIYVASLKQRFDAETIAFIPPHLRLKEAEALIDGGADRATLRETLGGRHYDEAAAETIATLERANRDNEATERFAEPLRRRLQSRRKEASEAARRWMAGVGVVETDLCSAWHHLPAERRELLKAALIEFTKETP